MRSYLFTELLRVLYRCGVLVADWGAGVARGFRADLRACVRTRIRMRTARHAASCRSKRGSNKSITRLPSCDAGALSGTGN
jgi:hypothetical protein